MRVHRERPVAVVGNQDRSDLHVVADQVPLGQAVFGEEDFVQVRQVDRPARDLPVSLLAQAIQGGQLVLTRPPDPAALADPRRRPAQRRDFRRLPPPRRGVALGPSPPGGRLQRFLTAAIRVLGPLPRDRPGIDVVAHPQEDRHAHDAVLGPLRELHLGHQLRLGPGRLLVRPGRRAAEGGFLDSQRLEPAGHLDQRPLVEAAAGVARVDQLAVVVDAHQ